MQRLHDLYSHKKWSVELRWQWLHTENPFPRLLGSASVVNGVNCDHYQLRLKGDKKQPNKSLWPYLSSTSSYRKEHGVFPGALSMLILNIYLTLFLATKPCKILQNQWIVFKIIVKFRFTFSCFYFDIINVSVISQEV